MIWALIFLLFAPVAGIALFALIRSLVARRFQRSSPRLLLVCSQGGHLREMMVLNEAVWQHYDRVWVSLRQADAVQLLADERVLWGYGPTNRNYGNLARNASLSIAVLWRERPNCVISTGAGLAIPFFLFGWLFGCRCIYLESFARKTSLSLTGKAVMVFADEFFVQSPELAARYRRTRYCGSLYQ